VGRSQKSRRDAGGTEVRFRRGTRCGVWGGLKIDVARSAWLGRLCRGLLVAQASFSRATCRRTPVLLKGNTARLAGGAWMARMCGGRRAGYWKAGSFVRRNQVFRTMWRENHLVARRARPRELMRRGGRRRPIWTDQSSCSGPKRLVSNAR
jgi:hypothetical protein